MRYLKYIFFIAFFLILPSVSEAADRYWVGGTDDWNATAGTKWATTSGGAGGAAIPGASDDVFFDAASGAGTVTITTGVTINSLDFNGYTGSFTHNAAVTITIDNKNSGNHALRMVSGMTYTKGNVTTSAFSFTYTSTGATITVGGKAPGNVTFSGAGGEWTLQDTFDLGGTLTLTSGTLNTNGQSVSARTFSSDNGNTRTMTFGSSAISLYTDGSGFDATNVTGLTVTANTATLTLTGDNMFFDSGTKDWNGLSLVYNGSVSSNDNFTLLSSGSTFANITHTGEANKTSIFNIAGSFTVTGTLTLTGNSSINRLLVQSSVLGTSRTITNTGATMTWSNVDLKDVDLSNSYDCSAITGLCGDAGGNTNITFTTGQTNYWIGNTGNWSDVAEWANSSGGSASSGRVPLPQDDATFDANSFSTTGFTVTADMPRAGKNISFAAVGSDNPILSISTTNSVFGSFEFNTGMTQAGAAGITMEGRGAFTLTNDGVSWTRTLTISAFGGTVTLQDAFSTSSTLTFTNGTFDANDFNVTAAIISVSGSATKVVTMGNGTWTGTSTGTVWSFGTLTGTTVNEEGSTIIVSNTTATSKIFAGGGETYYNLTITGDDVTITGNNTFNVMALNNPTEAEGLIIGTGSTQTIASITTTASASNVVLLSGVAGGGAETLSDSTGTNCIDYATITNTTVSGGATWYAGANSTDGGGNSGWSFTACPATSSNSANRVLIPNEFKQVIDPGEKVNY